MIKAFDLESKALPTFEKQYLEGGTTHNGQCFVMAFALSLVEC